MEPFVSAFKLPPIERWPVILRWLVRPPSLRTRWIGGIIITAALACTGYFDITTGDRVDLKHFYWLFVFAAFMLFRLRGVWWLAGVILCYAFNLTKKRLPPPEWLAAVDILGATVSFSLIGLFISWLADSLSQIQKSHENLRLDLKLASEVQRQILRPPLRLPWLNIAGELRSLGDVGGDFYVFEQVEPEKVFFAIGDVQGKGVSASLTMAMLTALFSELSKQMKRPDEILSLLNSKLVSSNSRFATVFAGIATNLGGGRLELIYSKAGHENGVIVEKNGWREIGTPGMPLGVMDGERYESHSCVMNCGDRLILYTDGVSDARSETGAPFGREAIGDNALHFSEEAPYDGLERLLHRLLDEAEAHRGKSFQEDDMTLLGIEPSSPG